MTPARMGVEKASHEEPPPVGAHAVALHHQFGGALQGDGRPDGRPGGVHRYRDLLDLGAELLELRRRQLDGCIYGRLRVRVTESLLHDAYLETFYANSEPAVNAAVKM